MALNRLMEEATGSHSGAAFPGLTITRWPSKVSNQAYPNQHLANQACGGEQEMAMRGVTIAWHLARRQQASELSARAWSASLGIRGFASSDEKVRNAWALWSVTTTLAQAWLGRVRRRLMSQQRC